MMDMSRAGLSVFIIDKPRYLCLILQPRPDTFYRCWNSTQYLINAKIAVSLSIWKTWLIFHPAVFFENKACFDPRGLDCTSRPDSLTIKHIKEQLQKRTPRKMTRQISKTWSSNPSGMFSTFSFYRNVKPPRHMKVLLRPWTRSPTRNINPEFHTLFYVRERIHPVRYSFELRAWMTKILG